MKEMSFPKSKCSSRIYTSSTVDSQLIESRHVKQTVINKTDSIFASYNWKSWSFDVVLCCNNGIFIRGLLLNLHISWSFLIKSVLWIRHYERVLLLDSDKIGQSEHVYWNAC